MVTRLDTAPLSLKAQRKIMDIIEGMDLAASTKLPREEALAEELGVSRTTIRQALNNLASEGIVFRQQGRGTFVNTAMLGIHATFSPCMELTDAIRHSGYTPSVSLLRIGPIQDEAACADVRSALRLAPDEPLLELDKAFFADGKPCAFCRDRLGVSTVGGKEGIDALRSFDDSVYRFVFDRCGRRVSWDKAQIGVAAPEELRALGPHFANTGVSPRPYLLVRTVNYDQNDQPIIAALEYVDTSVISYDLIRQKSMDYLSER